MFELTIIKKYMAPRWRHLSISIISLISILVITLVVWLVLVFFSVTNGLEKNWIEKLTAVTAPVRVVPTAEYYRSYYYQIDGISAGSDYTHKSIGEKLASTTVSTYDPAIDQEPPLHWPPPHLNPDNEIADLVQGAFAAIREIKGVQASEYEVTGANLKLKLLRINSSPPTQAALNQSTYISNIDPSNKALEGTRLPLSPADINNYYSMLTVTSDHLDGDSNQFIYSDAAELQERLRHFFHSFSIQTVETPSQGWSIPRQLWPQHGEVKGAAWIRNGKAAAAVMGANSDLRSVKIVFTPKGLELFDDKSLPVALEGGFTLRAPPGLAISAHLNRDSLATADTADEVLFTLDFSVQKAVFHGTAPLGTLLFKNVKQIESPPAFSELGDAILLPKTFHEAGVLLGDRGHLTFFTPTASNMQEQRLPIYVAGFFDPGILPMGGKLILVNSDITALIRSSHESEDSTITNGINVRFDNLHKANLIKEQIEAKLQERGLSPFWKVETFREYEHTRDILQQLQSDKTLLTLISLIIIVVACSNIISMLIILVNDKKKEIGILRSLGASSRQIATIFGGCGMLIGLIGSCIGILFAVITIRNIHLLVNLLSAIQGHEAFNPLFYGDQLPNQLSYEAMIFVFFTTTGISLIAGLVPACKACWMKPVDILKSE